MKCSFQSSWGILMENRLASVRLPSCLHPPWPQHCSQVASNKGTLANTALDGRAGPGYTARTDAATCSIGNQSFTLYIGLGFLLHNSKKKEIIRKKKKISINYLFQLFTFLWLEIQNKQQWTFHISYNCKLIPFIYPHFMQQVKGKSYKQSLSWKYSPFFAVPLSIMCSGRGT